MPQKKSLAEARRNTVQKELYRSGNGFVKPKMWNCPARARGNRQFAMMGHPPVHLPVIVSFRLSCHRFCI